MFVDDQEKLSSSLVDYSQASNSSNPFRSIYNTPNTMFFGDDTSKANSQISLSQITLDPLPVPEPLTIFGTMTALGFGAMFKRKNNFKKG